MSEIDWKALAAPFAADEIEWRIGNKAKSGKSATLLCYLTARAVMDRLDTVLGPGRWQDSYTAIVESGKTAGYLCTLAVEVAPGAWVSKTDVSDTTDVEALKGGISGALKRAAVKWGIGRYLYGVDTRYHPIRDGDGPDDKPHVGLQIEQGRYGHVLIPTLPAWALPTRSPGVTGNGSAGQQPANSTTKTATAAADGVGGTPGAAAAQPSDHDPEWQADHKWFHAARGDVKGGPTKEEVDRLCAATVRFRGKRPSQIGRKGREELLRWLAEAGQAALSKLRDARQREPGEEG